MSHLFAKTMGVSSLSVGFMAFASKATLAASAARCMVNGQEVPCDQLGEQVAGFLGWGIGLFFFFGLIGLASTIFWIWMIIHAAQHNIENKPMWIIILVLTGILGALIYYFAVKRPFDKRAMTPPSAPTMPSTPPTPPTQSTS